MQKLRLSSFDRRRFGQHSSSHTVVQMQLRPHCPELLLVRGAGIPNACRPLETRYQWAPKHTCSGGPKSSAYHLKMEDSATDRPS